MLLLVVLAMAATARGGAPAVPEDIYIGEPPPLFFFSPPTSSHVSFSNSGGFFPASGWPVKEQVEPAYLAALQEVNQDPSLLPGFRLLSRTVDSRCSPGAATGAFQAQASLRPPSLALVGGGCSAVWVALSGLNGPRELGYAFNVPLVSWGSTSDRLSDKEAHPYFSRVVGPDAGQARALLRYVRSQGWRRVGLLSQRREPHLSLRFNLKEFAAAEGVQVVQDDQLSTAEDSAPLMPEFIARAPAEVARIDRFRINCFGHVGEGNLHYNVLPAKGRNRADYEGQRDAVKRVVHDLVHDLGGSFSAEHGVGRVKVDDLERYGDPAKLTAMRAIKTALDPQGIMNPGAVLRA